MSAPWPWIERKFIFDFPVGKFPDILERYRGTPARLEERVRGLAAAVLVKRDAPGTWSIQENCGHLNDTEPLWATRIEEFMRGAATLTAADMSNAVTHNANHNGRALAEILAEFRRVRMRLVTRLEGLSDADWGRTALHPRLKQPMRLVDGIMFACDHDDYHMARISELLKKFA